MLCFFKLDNAVKSADYWFKQNKWTWGSFGDRKCKRPSRNEICKCYKDLKASCNKDNIFATTGRLFVSKKKFLGITFYIYGHEV